MPTFLFTDIEGSTALWEQHPSEMRIALARHDLLLRDATSRNGGSVYKSTGDGVLAAFPEAHEALSAALTMRAALLAEPWPTPKAIKVRIALVSGDAWWRDGEYYGPAVNVVARLLAICRGGQTLLAVRDSLADAADAASLVRHGAYRLKGVDEPVEVAELHVAGTPGLPPDDDDKAYRVVRDGSLWRPLRDVRHNLPHDRDTFVGRAAELRQLASHLRSGAQLVTVVGTGGVGKTRLACRYAAAWLGEWPGGVYFCDLSEVRTREGILVAVARALGVPLAGGNADTQLGSAIAARGPCLVILDNFEQVAEHAPATVGAWMSHAPRSRFLVTSRERLQIEGERTYTLEPLDLDGDALDLFEARASAHRPGFVVEPATRRIVAEIVRSLDGLPLAIELAAARTRVLGLAQIAERTKGRFGLAAGRKRGSSRHDTLRAAIDWSWELLSSIEQSAMAQLAVFEGGFTAEAAEAVLDLPLDAQPVIDVMQALVDKSLIRLHEPRNAASAGATPHFGMYLSIHEYAGEKLAALGSSARERAGLRHARYYAELGSEEAQQALCMHGGVARRNALSMELDNLVAACRHAMARNDAQVAAGCFLAAYAVLQSQGPFSLGVELGRRLLLLEGLDMRHRARVQVALGDALRTCGDVEAANAVLEAAVATARHAHDARVEAFALRHLAIGRHREGRTSDAEQCFREALALTEASGDVVERGALFANFANLQMEQGSMREALGSYRTAIALHRDVGNRAAEAVALGNLGTLHYELGETAEARSAYEAALAIHRDAGSLLQEAITLCNLGILRVEEGNHDAAMQNYGAALDIHRNLGNRRGAGVVLQQIGDLHLARGELAAASERFDEALAIHRAVGNRRFEGGVLGSVGELLIQQRRFDAAQEALARGEHLLRSIDDPLSVAKLLCARGRASLGSGDVESARLALLEADGLAARLGAQPGSELRRGIDQLRNAVRGATPPG